MLQPLHHFLGLHHPQGIRKHPSHPSINMYKQVYCEMETPVQSSLLNRCTWTSEQIPSNRPPSTPNGYAISTTLMLALLVAEVNNTVYFELGGNSKAYQENLKLPCEWMYTCTMYVCMSVCMYACLFVGHFA